mmetsp:Transcript_73455/g.157400  ORF Transcript_73455/g.157400 Transcript_73455/m.157400 type:complete len:735 (-) Transcript_73455:34-2238(-)
MVQIEFEVLPAAIGAVAYLLYHVACNAFRAHKLRRAARSSILSSKKLGEDAMLDVLDDDFEVMEEPAAEPATEPAAEPQPDLEPEEEVPISVSAVARDPEPIPEAVLKVTAASSRRAPPAPPPAPPPWSCKHISSVALALVLALALGLGLAAAATDTPCGGFSSALGVFLARVCGDDGSRDFAAFSPSILGGACSAVLEVKGAGAEAEVAGKAGSSCASSTRPSTEAHFSAAELEADEVPASDQVLTVTLTRQTVDMDSAGDFVRSAYYGTLMVGSPPEPFTVVFDTGSGHLILPSTYCRSETCSVHKRYRRSASFTGKDINYDGRLVHAGQMRDQITVSFGTGEVTGVFVEDIVCVDGLNVDGQDPSLDASGVAEGSSATTAISVLAAEATADFANAAAFATPTEALEPVVQPLRPGCVSLRVIAATELSEEPFKSFQFDGILGLGLDGLSQAPEFNFLGVVAQSLGDWGGGMPHTFAVFLAENEDEESEIALGGWAKKHLREELSWGPIEDPEMGHWILPIRGLRVDGERLSFCDQGCKAAVDTGTSLLAVPTAAFPEMYELLKHPAPLAGHCQGYGPLLHIELDHFTVTLGPRDYARLEPSSAYQWEPQLYEDVEVNNTGSQREVRHDLRCLPTLMTLDLPEPLGPKLFILGEPVLRKYYTVYDGFRKRVGFGRARHRLAPSREDLLVMAAERSGLGSAADDGGPGGASTPRPRRASPTMFDIFRWRRQLR